MILPNTHPRSESMGEPAQESIEKLARLRVIENSAYGLRFRDISIHHAAGVLTMRGRLPSFHLKQILQTLLRDLEGVEQIDNQTDVVSATGLSGVRHLRS